MRMPSGGRRGSTTERKREVTLGQRVTLQRPQLRQVAVTVIFSARARERKATTIQCKGELGAIVVFEMRMSVERALYVGGRVMMLG